VQLVSLTSVIMSTSLRVGVRRTSLTTMLLFVASLTNSVRGLCTVYVVDCIVSTLYNTSVQDVLLWRTHVLTEGLPLLFGAPFSI